MFPGTDPWPAYIAAMLEGVRRFDTAALDAVYNDALSLYPIERVSSLPRKLSTRGAPEGMAPVAGELTHYAPWGNLALFVEGRTWSRSLLPLGKVDDGLPLLSQPGPYSVRIERVEP